MFDEDYFSVTFALLIIQVLVLCEHVIRLSMSPKAADATLTKACSDVSF